ncbi:hypothetical protein [Halapricum hydrolyticum]|uniref:Uncharacterized protein n=1 Tax=Halapricum hydrolyticum TaxID=2979991 RepID=A0AAE3IBN5_9EURY|nr:hypothetical protein [Halapricum hydrolyticum]MCU4716885.1 hypothetical protein [Halapricum hydrolyticum]MCU4725510.1 hypothetical protein [Halapricum hydrolyticum]
MTDVDDMTLDEIEARLDELREEKAEARELRERIGDAHSELREIRQHRFVDDDLAVKLGFIDQMLGMATHEDLHAEVRIHHERERLRRRKIELERQEAIADD